MINIFDYEHSTTPVDVHLVVFWANIIDFIILIIFLNIIVTNPKVSKIVVVVWW